MLVSYCVLAMAMSPQVPKGRRIFWNGPLFGRLGKSGRSLLLERGWERLSSTPSIDKDDEPLAFIWPNKSGPQFPTNEIFPAFVRPFPTCMTDCLDDKLRLSLTLEPFEIMPSLVHNIDDTVDDGTLYFVKHRHGAQGKSVYVHNKTTLQAWEQTTRNVHDFVIQEQVLPALDDKGRKFVLRGHVLLYKRSDNHDARIRVALHQDVICQSHSVAYEPSLSCPKAVHVSQAGKKLPIPCLLSDLPSSHPAAGLFPAVVSCSNTLVKATRSYFDRETIASGVTCFALLGVDYLVSRDGEVKICEVNSHPALGWGTMSEVPKHVFARLIQEMLDIVVFDVPLSTTGFVALSIENE